MEGWSQVNEWHRALYRHPRWPPNPEGGSLEELRNSSPPADALTIESVQIGEVVERI